APDQPQFGADVPRVAHQGLRRLRIGTYCRPPGAEDAGLLVADGFARVTEVVLMVHRDRRDDGTIRVEHIDRIQTSAQPHLEHDHVEPIATEHMPCRERAVFEIGQRGVFTRGLDRIEGLHQGRVIDFPAIDAHALVVTQQMRGGVQTDTMAAGAQHRLEHRAGRALAVGATDGDDHRVAGACHARTHRLDTLQPELDRVCVARLEQPQPGVEGLRRRHADDRDQEADAAGAFWRVSKAMMWASSSRISRRSTIMSIAPFSRRNSERRKPSGRVSRTVCSITRGPAKPISAPGSAMTTSPRNAKLADTPPMVGSVRTEMNGSRLADSWVTAAVVLAICISESRPSCMRAPPAAVKQTNGNC